ncbi:helix-turn-helix domain-containing protein [Streptomyces sp. NPDC051677]|uniref:helix-turn-helix domain-containing protein n=1 Tax=Streptomyces sp. NPDC051677 TaxID=3365669 RepID=UPI0037D07472
MDSRGRRASDDPQGESLSELLRSWRSRSDPRAFPGLMVPGRRSVGLSQRDVARLTGVSERWYGSLERGNEANYSADFLDRLSSVLQLSRAERHVLYLRAIGRPPALAAVPETDAASEMDDILQQFLDSQSPNPAYVSDLAWNVIGHNEPLRDWFPWAAHQANLMRWVFLSREAREQLVNWREDWARPYLGQIRYARVHYPQNEALRRLERDILAGSPDLQKIWDRCEVYEHANGGVRRLKLPCHRGREVVVRITALRPMGSDRLRVIVLMESRRGAASG